MRRATVWTLLATLAVAPPSTARSADEAASSPVAASSKPAREPAETRPPAPEPKPEERHTPIEQAHETGPGRVLKWDMAEAPPVVTHHELHVAGRSIRYAATAGRLPIKDAAGTIDAEMFFVAYTLDGQAPGTRPLVFAFNGGPGSASLWLHLGALGPKKVALGKDGFLPAPPYRMMDNENSLLEKSDLVLVDAVGTGFSRPADSEKEKRFLGLRGDIEAFGEFVRLYLVRYGRWSSPLYLMGESYGTTRAAGLAGHLADLGISFNGIVLLSMVIDLQTTEFTRRNDLAAELALPSFAMVAAYHHRLAPELNDDLQRTRAEVEHFATNEYALALGKGDALTPAEREAILAKLARYTALPREVIDLANLRVNVSLFTRYLLADKKLRVGRFDGRYAGPNPRGFFEDRDAYDPTEAAILPPFTSVFNDYVERELGYRAEMPYNVFAGQWQSREGQDLWPRWNWGSASEGFPDTASALKAAMVKNPYLKVLVLEGYYDLATPYFAADYTMNHLDLAPEYRRNISFATYESGHMVYLRESELAKMRRDLGDFIDKTRPRS